MTVFVALLRAVNVGGTGKLPMADLKQMCEGAGFNAVRTYIASGNLVLESGKTEGAVKAALESTLRSYAGRWCACAHGGRTRGGAGWRPLSEGGPGPDRLQLSPVEPPPRW